ncbi:MAG: DNA-directed RNA polymerase subunit E'' [Candidatus Lokiarchaeota archaeon]|nr:DNA-directed RNA polymerase subunit E'' [Candidatus Lokiarchaeota archaeon]
MTEKACRICRHIEEDSNQCSKCKSFNLSSEFSGFVIIIDPESMIAKKLQIKEPGKYALKVR